MSKESDTLRDLLIARGLAGEAAAAEYAASIGPVEAKRLVDLLMSQQGGPSRNLDEGTGGFLSGISQVIEARRIAAALSVPEEPWLQAREAKAAAAEKFESDVRASNEAIVAGLRLILRNKSAEFVAPLEVWGGELSDEDFARKRNDAKAHLNESDDTIVETTQRMLEEQTAQLEALIASHRDAADER